MGTSAVRRAYASLVPCCCSRSAAVVPLAGFGVACAIAMQSSYGRDFWQFVQTSRIELRKVVWPNRQETLQTTLVVLVFVLVSGLFFWLLDMVLAWATKQLTGQGG